MRATFEQASSFTDPTSILGCHAYDRGAIFQELSREYGSEVPYTTFYGWCGTLKLESGKPLYTASEALLLLTLVWARFGRKLRSLNRETVEQLQGNYACYRVNRNT